MKRSNKKKVLLLIFVVLGIVLTVVSKPLYSLLLPGEGALFYFESLSYVNITLVLAAMFFSGALGYYIARRKGRNPFFWLFVCILLNFWGILFLWFANGKETTRNTSKNMTRADG